MDGRRFKDRVARMGHGLLHAEPKEHTAPRSVPQIEDFDEAQLTAWVKQAAALPGEKM
jgi:hypothetical protein